MLSGLIDILLAFQRQTLLLPLLLVLRGNAQLSANASCGLKVADRCLLYV
jgi:hypothetical protein